MSSRAKMLANVFSNMPEKISLENTPKFLVEETDLVQKFSSVATTIGGSVVLVSGYNEIEFFIKSKFSDANRIVTPITELAAYKSVDFSNDVELKSYKDIDLAIINGHFGVAENGSIWVTEELLGDRVIPFITQHLAIILRENEIVSSMHIAYERIGSASYGYGCFIAGPSKTADIEQSLVLGAHGPRSLTVFLIGTSI
ncbi:MAG: lactate utilization protein [Sphingobacteriales bacterium]|nr:lactate utilization protein [Sphingobacteriales bacterium]